MLNSECLCYDKVLIKQKLDSEVSELLSSQIFTKKLKPNTKSQLAKNAPIKQTPNTTRLSLPSSQECWHKSYFVLFIISHLSCTWLHSESRQSLNDSWRNLSFKQQLDPFNPQLMHGENNLKSYIHFSLEIELFRLKHFIILCRKVSQMRLLIVSYLTICRRNKVRPAWHNRWQQTR